MDNSGQVYDFNNLRYAGWPITGATNGTTFLCPQVVRLISRKVTELTRGVDHLNRSIVVPDERIYEVMDGVLQSYKPATGDIFTRYVVPNNEPENAIQSMIDQTIEIITTNIRSTLGIEQNNQSLSAWVQVYGDFNTNGLRAHSILKIREKRPSPFQFHMNY